MRTDAPARASIYKLPASVVNKIAAGEVIERPASVVKELVENSIDAGSRRIDVQVERGGMELIRVVDDGCGIPPDELPLALDSHATSKLRDADDLYRVATLGFRGEALASIAEISRFRLKSRTEDSELGAEIESVGGRLGEVQPVGAPPGTTIDVAELFYNTPVRRKFMRTVPTELGHIGEALNRVALAHPHVHFTLRHGDRLVHDLPPSEQWIERVAGVFGRELAESLIWVESADNDVRLYGYVAHPSQSRSHQRMQYLFLNGRHVRDRALQHALREAYRGLLLTGRFPIAFLCFDMPPEMVDVNVHPTKLEVRFQHSDRHYSQLLGTLRTQFLTTDLDSKWKAARTPAEEEPRESAPQQPNADDRAQEQARQEIVRWALSQQGGEGSADDRPDAPWEADDAKPELPFQEGDSDRRPLPLVKLPQAREAGQISAPVEHNEAAAPAEQHEPSSPPAVSFSGVQIHNRYLVTQNDDGLVIIDQHALHERILYEHLRKRVLAGDLESQRLLVPEPVDLSPAEAAAAVENSELLAQLGLTVEPFGGETVLVSSYPAMLANVRPAELLREVVDALVSGGKQPDRRDVVDELLHMMSCKAAIKAGDKLTPEEIEALLVERDLVQDTHHCPHGRPTALIFTREQLDRQFKRT